MSITDTKNHQYQKITFEPVVSMVSSVRLLFYYIIAELCAIPCYSGQRYSESPSKHYYNFSWKHYFDGFLQNNIPMVYHKNVMTSVLMQLQQSCAAPSILMY